MAKTKGAIAMQAPGEFNSTPELQQLDLRATISEAIRALALLDADRLEELARSCQILNRDLTELPQSKHSCLAERVTKASLEMAVFAHVLDATRANLGVVRRLRDLREGRLEYSARPAILAVGGDPWEPSVPPSA